MNRCAHQAWIDTGIWRCTLQEGHQGAHQCVLQVGSVDKL